MVGAELKKVGMVRGVHLAEEHLVVEVAPLKETLVLLLVSLLA